MPTSMFALISGNTSKIDAAIGMFSQFEIIEAVRTGKVVLARSEQATSFGLFLAISRPCRKHFRHGFSNLSVRFGLIEVRKVTGEFRKVQIGHAR
ncbi:MAG: hypothetical protein WCS43_19345 [Verrucomicrobiota bacterium]